MGKCIAVVHSVIWIWGLNIILTCTWLIWAVDGILSVATLLVEINVIVGLCFERSVATLTAAVMRAGVRIGAQGCYHRNLI